MCVRTGQVAHFGSRMVAMAKPCYTAVAAHFKDCDAAAAAADAAAGGGGGATGAAAACALVCVLGSFFS